MHFRWMFEWRELDCGMIFYVSGDFHDNIIKNKRYIHSDLCQNSFCTFSFPYFKLILIISFQFLIQEAFQLICLLSSKSVAFSFISYNAFAVLFRSLLNFCYLMISLSMDLTTCLLSFF